MFIFDAAKLHISTLVYPSFLLIAVVPLVVGLGVFQRPSFDTELDKKKHSKAAE